MVLMRARSSAFAFLIVLVVLGFAFPSPVAGQGPATFSFSLPGSSVVSCWYWTVAFTATEGVRVSVEWNETSPPTSLDVYIIPQASMREIWRCDAGPVALYYDSGAYGSMAWAAPSTGEYGVLLENYNVNSASGTLSITAVNATVTATPLGYATARTPPPCLGPDCLGS